jgi:hypothetical protein
MHSILFVTKPSGAAGLPAGTAISGFVAVAPRFVPLIRSRCADAALLLLFIAPGRAN